jgi:hypothetical protein
MSIRNIESILIPGFSGLKLFSFDYTPGFAEGPGSVVAQFINESGSYPEIPVTSHSYSEIFFTNKNNTKTSLGNFTIVSSEEQETEKVKILIVKFVDKSIELDRFMVALKGQVGYDQITYQSLPALEKPRIVGAIENGGRIIWVGQSDEACKENILGENSGGDPCDPCPERLTDPQYRQLDCEQYYKNNRRIYRYTFNDLAFAAGATGLSFSGIYVPDDYKFEYVGTLRQVLNNICSDLGYSFFYNPISNSISFINVRLGLNINLKNLNSNPDKIITKSILKTREGSKNIFGVASYSRDSEEKRYSCGLNSCRKLVMSPFTLTDILEEPAHFKENSGLAGFKRLEFYSMLNARVGKEFRDLFVWLQEYKIKKAEDLNDWVDKKLIKLNGMTIKGALSPFSEDNKDKVLYRILLAAHTAKNSENMEEKARTNKPYFFIAEVDERYEEKINNVEISLANNFFGQYWIRRFKEHWKGLSYSTLAPDATVEYYDFKKPINLPFSDIIYEAYGNLESSPLLDRNGMDNIAGGNSPNSLEARDTFFLMSRPAISWPVKLEDELLKTIGDNVSKYLFKEFAAPLNIENVLKKKIENYDPSRFKIYIVENSFEDLDINLDINDNVNHPEEVQNVTINTNTCGKYTSYGLRSARTRSFDIKFVDSSFTLFMPVQSYVKDSGSHSGYTIILERSGEDGTYIMPKAEIFSSDPSPNYGDFHLGIDLNLYNANSNDLSLLAKSLGQNYCDMDYTKIKSLLDTLRIQNSYSIGVTQENKYTLEGLPDDSYSPADGLKSMNITVGRGGLSTSLQFNNSHMFKLSAEDYLRKLNFIRLKQLSSSFPNGNYNNSTLNDLPEI